jgi:hypothetical protein
LIMSDKRFPRQALYLERESATAKERSREMDKRLREKLGLPPLEERRYVSPTTVDKRRPRPSSERRSARPGRYAPRAGHHAINKGSKS